MFCIACMICAYEVAVTKCDNSPSHCKEQENAKKDKDVCVLNEVYVSTVVYVCFV